MKTPARDSSSRGPVGSMIARAVLLGFCFLVTPAFSHEVRPGYLEIGETAAGRFEVMWKQPLRDGRRLVIDPLLPAHCEVTGRAAPELTRGAVIERWEVDCGTTGTTGQVGASAPSLDEQSSSSAVSRVGLEGHEVILDGLARTLVDVLVRIRFLDGEELAQLVRPEAPSFVVRRGGVGAAVWAYLRLGIEHLLFGFDHILFVIGLMFFVKRFSELLKVITAFTLAHSITLALSTLGALSLQQSPVEAVIALSILFLAVEYLRGTDNGGSWTARMPWTIAFGFGLLHGFGFAGALAEIGLPREGVGPALLLFNVGVELGQLLIVGCVLGLLALLRLAKVQVPKPLVRMPMYAIGIISAYWFVERVVGILG